MEENQEIRGGKGEKRILGILHFCMVASIYLENFQLCSILGAPLMLSHLVFAGAVPISLRSSRGKVSRKSLPWILFFLALPALPLYRIGDLREWVKSYAVWALSVLYLGLAFRIIRKGISDLERRKMIRLFFFLASGTELLAICQFLLMNTAGVLFLAHVFGPFQRIPAFVSQKGGLYRAFSIFHEPSVLGWMVSNELSVLFYVEEERILSPGIWRLCLFLSIFAMLVSISASGMFQMLALLTLFFILRGKKRKILLQGLIVPTILLLLWCFTPVLQPLMRARSEAGREGTSGYERLTLSKLYAEKTLERYPLFGRGIGQSGEVDQVGVISTGISERANNAFYELIVNFGLSALFPACVFVLEAVRSIRRDTMSLLLYVSLSGILLSTGAYLSMDFLSVLNFTMLLIRPSGQRKGRREESVEEG